MSKTTDAAIEHQNRIAELEEYIQAGGEAILPQQQSKPISQVKEEKDAR